MALGGTNELGAQIEGDLIERDRLGPSPDVIVGFEDSDLEMG